MTALMINKKSQGRLLIPRDIWDVTNFDSLKDPSFGFFLTEDLRVVITTIDVGELKKYQYLGHCKFDDKHRFFISHNVDTYLGDGNRYYFSIFLNTNLIYINKK